jgi:hypothetical protein
MSKKVGPSISKLGPGRFLAFRYESTTLMFLKMDSERSEMVVSGIVTKYDSKK